MSQNINMSQLIKQIGLDGYKVLDFDDSKPKESLLSVEVADTPPSCLNCSAKPDQLRSKGRYKRNVRHLEAFGRMVQLRVLCRRYQCLQCSKSFVQPLPGIKSGRHSSEPFRYHVYRQHRDGISGRSVALAKKIGSATVERIYQQYTVLKAKERLDLTCPTVLGIDEHSIHTKQRFATTFCDLKNHRVFDVVEGRSTSDLETFLLSLKGREQVKMVCIDLSSSYKYLIERYFPNARIVADGFHVIRVIQHHFMELVRSITAEVKSHRGYLAALRTRPDRLCEKKRARLKELFEKHPAIEPIYDQMQRVLRLMNQKTKTARQCRRLARQLTRTIDLLRASGFKPMKTLAKTLKTWDEEIACMWRFRKSNGITEGFHRKMKLIQRRAYGFRNFNNYRLRVIAECG